MLSKLFLYLFPFQSSKIGTYPPIYQMGKQRHATQTWLGWSGENFCGMRPAQPATCLRGSRGVPWAPSISRSSPARLCRVVCLWGS